MTDSKWNSIPNGGFPNIQLKKNDDQVILDQNKKLQLKNPNSKIVNVAEILQRKRHTDPYLPLSIGDNK